MRNLLLCLFLSVLFPFYARAQWTTVCGNGNGMVVSLASYDGSVYAAGFFTKICGVNAKYIARWDGASWYPMDTGLSDAGHNVRVLDTELYVAQYMRSIDSNWVEKWDGSHFVRVGAGVYLTTASSGSHTPDIYDVIKYNGHLVASGEFDVVGNEHISGIMQWNGTQWDSLGSGLSGSLGGGVMYPHQLMVYGGDLYVVGDFVSAGGVTVNGVARWDGTQWHAMGAGFNAEVYGIGVINGSIYVGGGFSLSGSTPLSKVAKWNGSAWVDPGFYVYYANTSEYAYVHTVQQIGAHGIFEGGFDRVVVGTDTFVANDVVAFDGTSVDTLSGGIPTSNLEGVVAHDSNIMVGGALFPGFVADTTNVSEYHFSPAGIRTVQASEYAVYPDPFTDVVTVENVKKESELRLFNMLGQQILHTVLHDTKENIDLHQLSPGVYILQISYKGSQQYKKLLKQ